MGAPSLFRILLLVLGIFILTACGNIAPGNGGPEVPGPELPEPGVPAPELPPPPVPPVLPEPPQPPEVPPEPPEPPEVPPPAVNQMLQLVNAFRSAPQNCGGGYMPATPPLSWDERLERAALLHSEYMAETGNFSHTGANGTSVSDRVSAQGYAWSRVGENIALGYPNASAAFSAWVQSAGHCRNIMNPAFRDMGVARTDSVTGRPYWTQVFARPR